MDTAAAIVNKAKDYYLAAVNLVAAHPHISAGVILGLVVLLILK